MSPSEIKSLLESHGLRPVHGRGQNFLKDKTVVKRMAEAAGVAPQDRIVEIGPGLGVLTEELLARAAQVLAVELDSGIANIVRERISSERLDILTGDFLDQSLASLAARLGAVEGQYKIVANLPYSITSEALTKMLIERPRPSSVTVMVQREVAERATARPPQMGMLSLLIRTYGLPKIAFRVPASSFWPRPKVDSAVLCVKLHSDEEIRGKLGGVPPESLLGVARLAFSERRKQLKNTLGRKFPDARLEDAFAAAKIGPKERPERLEFEQWVTLAQTLLRKAELSAKI